MKTIFLIALILFCCAPRGATVLRGIVATVRKMPDPTKAIAVFDIHSTLLRMAPENLRIIGEFVEHSGFAHKFPEEVAFLRQLLSIPGVDHFEPLGRIPKPGEVLATLGLSDPHRDFYPALDSFIRQRSFGHYLIQPDSHRYDIPFEGAADFINRLHDEGVRIIYLTAWKKDTRGLSENAFNSLERHGFPIGADRAELVLRPDGRQTVEGFKEKYLGTLRAEHIWFFDNKPENINEIAQRLPNIQPVYFISTHFAGEVEMADGIPTVRDWVYLL